jgi:hypothetical protein
MFDPSDLQQRAVRTDPPNLIRAFTHTMTRTSGISVCFGTTQHEMVLSNTKLELQETNSTAAPSGAGVSQGSRGGEPAQQPHYRIRSLRALSRSACSPFAFTVYTRMLITLQTQDTDSFADSSQSTTVVSLSSTSANSCGQQQSTSVHNRIRQVAPSTCAWWGRETVGTPRGDAADCLH